MSEGKRVRTLTIEVPEDVCARIEETERGLFGVAHAGRIEELAATLIKWTSGDDVLLHQALESE